MDFSEYIELMYRDGIFDNYIYAAFEMLIKKTKSFYKMNLRARNFLILWKISKSYNRLFICGQTLGYCTHYSAPAHIAVCGGIAAYTVQKKT